MSSPTTSAKWCRPSEVASNAVSEPLAQAIKCLETKRASEGVSAAAAHLRHINAYGHRAPTLQKDSSFGGPAHPSAKTPLENVMQQPADMTCNVACAVLRDMSRTASFMLESQIDLAHFRLKLAEAALEDVRELEHELSGTHDWTSLASAQSLFMKMQSSHSATALKTWAEFTNKLQAAYLRRLTEWTQQMQQPEGQTSSSQLFAASSDSLKAFFDSFNLMALPDSEAKKTGLARSAKAKAEQAA
ncbi:hypothetical protein ABIC76_000155 [Ralstonia sp. 1138]